MVFLRKFTLVVAEIILFLTITVILAAPEYMIVASEYVTRFDLTLRLIVVVVIDLLLFMAIISQLRGGVSYKGEGLLVQAGDSNTTITPESVRQGISKAIHSIDAIETVDCEVTGEHGEAIIKMEVTTSKDDINIPNKQKEIDRAIKRVVVKQMGVKLAKPAVINIRLASDIKVSESRKSEPPKSEPPKPVVMPSAAAPVRPVTDPVTETPSSSVEVGDPKPEVEEKREAVTSKSVSDALVPPSNAMTEPVEPDTEPEK